VDESRSAATLSAKLDESWQKRKSAAEEWNEALRRGEIEPTLFRKFIWCIRSLRNGTGFKETFDSFEREWREKTGLKKPSLAFALNDTLGKFFWSGGAIKVCLPFRFKDQLIDLSKGCWGYISIDGTIISQGFFLHSLESIGCLLVSRSSLIFLRREGLAELAEKRR